MMNKVVALICVILSFAGKAQNIEGTVLFEVRHPYSEHVSYLFGTNHAFGKSFLDRHPVIGKKLLKAKRVILETDLSLPENSLEDIIRARDEITNWKKYFNSDDLEFVKGVLKREDAVFNRLTPAEIHSALYRYFAMKACSTRSPEDPDGTLDDTIGKIGKENGLSLTGLELVEHQLTIINKDVEGMPVKVHRRRLNAVLNKIRAQSATDCGPYEMYAQLEYDFRYDASCSNAVVLTERNNAWMEVLPEYLEKESCFIAVGLSHLQFECGLIAQLRELGYAVTPVVME